MSKRLTVVQRLNRIQKLTDCYLLAFSLRHSPESFMLSLKVMTNSISKENDKLWKVRFSALMKAGRVKDTVNFLKENANALFEDYLDICNQYAAQRNSTIGKEETEAFHAAFLELLKAVNAGLIMREDIVCEEAFRKMVEDAVIVGRKM